MLLHADRADRKIGDDQRTFEFHFRRNVRYWHKADIAHVGFQACQKV